MFALDLLQKYNYLTLKNPVSAVFRYIAIGETGDSNVGQL